MLNKIALWFWNDLNQHKSPYALVALAFIGSLIFTLSYATPASEFAGLQGDVGQLLESDQQERVEKMNLRIQELEYKDQHNNGEALPDHEQKELFKKRNELPGAKEKLKEIKERNKILGNAPTIWEKLPAFSLAQKQTQNSSTA